MNSFDDELNLRLAALREQNLFRELRRVDSAQGPRIEIGGKTFLNFSSNDYLGLANHPALKAAAVEAIGKFGAGAGASRLVCGSLAPFHELEAALAAFKKTEAALTFSTGYAAALGTITSLVTKNDIIILDKKIHASIVDAVRLSTPNVRVFPHNHLETLENHLKWADVQIIEAGAKKAKRPKTLVITESIFSMDGDAAPLREIVGLKNKYGAWLMVDEAHATGIIGENGRGLAGELGLGDQIEIQMGTLGKALGTSGGYICGSRALIDLLVNRARSFIFSTAPVPAAAAAATAAIQLIQTNEGEGLRKKLWQNIEQLDSKLPATSKQSEGGKIKNSKPESAIVPLIFGDENVAVDAAAKLRAQNIFVPAIRFPTVARGAARLRITLTAAHSAADISELADALKKLKTGL